MNTEFRNPPDLCPTFGWTHVVASRGGKTIHISGQAGIDAVGKVVGKDDLNVHRFGRTGMLVGCMSATGSTLISLSHSP